MGEHRTYLEDVVMNHRKIIPPDGSWLDSNGKRWCKVIFDVMTDGGTRFMRQITVTLGLHFDFYIGSYVIDHELGQPLTDEVLRQYPSLASVRDMRLLPAANKVL